MRIVIIGGVAGGATAATRLRRLSEKDEIVIYEKDKHIAYANCGLPYYLGGVIKDRMALSVQSPLGLKSRFNIDVKISHEVIEIDTKEKKVKVKNLENGEVFEDSFDKLIISCGANPRKLNIKGIDEAKNVFTLRNIGDTFAIDDYININRPKTALIVGGGFIGVEMAENLQKRGLKVSLVEALPQVMSNLDFEMAQFIHAELNNHDIEVILNTSVKELQNEGKVAYLSDGSKLNADIIIMAVGVVPESTLAKNANLKLGPNGHVQVDSNLNVLSQDGKPFVDIFAAGDMIEVTSPIDNSNYAVPLAWGANRQGRLIADKINGYEISAPKIMGVGALQVFNLTVASLGMNEKRLKAKNIDYAAVHAHRTNHAGYYPGASMISLKLLFDKKSGKIYGAQAVGGEGTEKRIDVIATAMKGGLTAFDLADVEICYAPPYSSAKDPVNILGYIAENVSKEKYIPFYAEDIEKLQKEKVFLVDVRTEYEFGNGSIESAVNIPVDSIRDNLDKFPKDKNEKIYIFCQIGLRGYIASMILKHNGYKNIYNLSGGYYTYKTYKRQLCATYCEAPVKISGGDSQMPEDI